MYTPDNAPLPICAFRTILLRNHLVLFLSCHHTPSRLWPVKMAAEPWLAPSKWNLPWLQANATTWLSLATTRRMMPCLSKFRRLLQHHGLCCSGRCQCYRLEPESEITAFPHFWKGLRLSALHPYGYSSLSHFFSLFTWWIFSLHLF